MLGHPKKRTPLIHCITNPISINQCANLILALSCRPIMAEHPDEVCEISKAADALLFNIGNITDVRMTSITLSSKVAKALLIPSVFDAVGVGCSSLRKKFASELLYDFSPTVIKGNYSEIKALSSGDYSVRGVDGADDISISEISDIAVKLAKKHGSIILASGKTDVICDGNKLIYIKNGCRKLGELTGTGCMLGAAVACFIASEKNADSVARACAMLGICGELASNTSGQASFFISLMDNISSITNEDILKSIKKEDFKIEKD